MTMEPLESRTLPSTGSLHAKVAPLSHHAWHTAVQHRSYVIAFYGLGGTGFDNQWLGIIADTAGKNTGSTVSKYQEDEGNQALVDFFSSVDTDGNHVLSSAEIDAATVRLVGFSFGAIQASEFSRALTHTNKPILGYRLSRAIPVRTLVTIDPVNSTPFKHTNGPVSNVQSYFNFYEVNPGKGTVQLLNRNTRQSTGSTVNLGDSLNPVGQPLASSARSSSQVFVDFGQFQNRRVTQYFNKRFYGTMLGQTVNHTTMPWYLFGDAVADLDI
jgi:hypothetical protein